ncbi:MAG: hypothetical protein V4696_07700 [Pseudomonadota bacterium]
MPNDALKLGASKVGPQRRTGRTSDWTEEMAERFVEELADTCNVTLAAKAIGRSIANIYKQRAKSATFRAAWDEALAVGYSRLEMMMLERALHGVEKKVVARDGTTTVMRQYSDRVALTLLRMHRDSAALAENDSEQGEDYRAACERIIGRLERLRERETVLRDEPSTSSVSPQDERVIEEDVETKAARDGVGGQRLRLIKWGLGVRDGAERGAA